MRLQADFGVVAFSGGSGYEKQRGFFTRGTVRFRNEPLADALMLVLNIDGEIGKITAKRKVSDGARDAYETMGVAGGDDQVSVAQHAGKSIEIVKGAALAERGSGEDGTKLFNGESGLKRVPNGHMKSSQDGTKEAVMPVV
jgi:hypothetical protein